MFFRLLLTLIFPFLLLNASQVENSPPQSWVIPCTASLETPPNEESEIHLQFLLYDKQTNFEAKSEYSHLVGRVLTQSGIEFCSKLHIEFNPALQTVQMHTIRVCRDGEWTDRLQSARHHILHREEELHIDLYNGYHTLVYFLEDIRKGDIVEYAYTIVGEDSSLDYKFSDIFSIQRNVPLEKFSYRLVARSDRPLYIKPFNTDLQPTVTDLTSTLREWHWEATKLSPFHFERDEPSWYFPQAYIQLTEYPTWNAVAAEDAPFYNFPEDITQDNVSSMIDLIHSWEMTTLDPKERALLALRFVQDEIRYLGLEEGEYSYIPRDPRGVFERRYGDCKEKTRLLSTLLTLMDISSSPVLVHHSQGKRLPHILPTPGAFDHVILRIEIDDTHYYVDPTITNQGGTLEETPFPSYHWGLVLSPHTTDLTPLPTPNPNPIQIETTYTYTTKKTATLKTTTTFRGIHADSIRNLIALSGKYALENNFLNVIQETYDNAASLAPLDIQDNRTQNTVTLTETYTFPTTGTLTIVSLTLDEYLDPRVHSSRTAPYALEYPLHIQEHIHIDNPYTNHFPTTSQKNFTHPALTFTHTLIQQGHTIDLALELHHLQDHVSTPDLSTYRTTTRNILHTTPTTFPIK